MNDTDLAALAGITVLPMSRDESVWDMLDRTADKFDPKTGVLVKPGDPKGHRDNVQLILAHDPWWADAFAYNTLSERVEWNQRDGKVIAVDDHHEAEIGLTALTTGLSIKTRTGTAFASASPKGLLTRTL